MPELVPIRYGRMLVSPFTFFRGAAYLMAADLAGDAAHRAARAAVRRRAPVELRRLRGARPAARVRHQRLRRDAARPVRVGRQAARGELRGRRPRPRLRRRSSAATINLAVGAGLPRGDAATSPAMRTLDLWYARLDVEELVATLGAELERRSRRKRFERNVAKARTKDSLQGVREAHRDRRRRAADRQRPAADRPDRGARRPSARTRSRSSCAA